jgi:enhancing lycopene biosynthesis protein 2
MAKRVGVLLSGCGRLDGSDVGEALLTLLVIERAGAEAVCAAPDADQAGVVDHLNGAGATGARNARVEAARLAGSQVLRLAELDANAIDALIVPGGEGPIATLSDYPERRELCTIHPDVARLLRGMLQGRRPMGFFGLSALFAARVLGPAAGVRITLGSKGTPYAKHAAVMGADVRPCVPEDLIVDQKARVYSSPGFLAEGARLPSVARAVDRLVRAVVGNARDRAPASAQQLDPFDVTGVSPTDRGRGSA